MTNPAKQTDATRGFFSLGLVGLPLGFFWASSSGLLLLLLLLVFWGSSSSGDWQYRRRPTGDCPSTPFYHFFWGGASSSRPRGHRPRPTKVSGHVPRCVTCYCQRGGECSTLLAVVAGGGPRQGGLGIQFIIYSLEGGHSLWLWPLLA
jgi:hypothetical protein